MSAELSIECGSDVGSTGGDVERMLMAQMDRAHRAAMDCFDRAALPGREDEVQARDLRLGAKLLAVYSWQVRTLDSWQRARGRAVPTDRMMVGWLDDEPEGDAPAG